MRPTVRTRRSIKDSSRTADSICQVQGKYWRQDLFSNGAEYLYRIPIILSGIMHTF
jgi:hypothetical protein